MRYGMPFALLTLLPIAGCRETVAPEEPVSPESSSADLLPTRGPILAFQRMDNGNGHNDIFLVATIGKSLDRLTFGPEQDLDPAWSPDGQKLAWVRLANGLSQIWVMNADGTGKIKLSRSDASDQHPVWSPDGTRILFERRSAFLLKGSWEIYAMNPTGHGAINLSNHPGLDEQARWSPSGTQVVFTSTRTGNREVYRVNADGSGLKNLTNNDNYDGEPDWSPDGHRIAFTRRGSGYPTSLLVMNADGSRQTKLASGLEEPFGPRWSPTGDRLLVQRSFDGQITVLNADGSDPHVVATSSSSGQGEPVWSPDGSRIAYWAWDASGNGFDEVQGLRTVAADGSGKMLVTNHLDDTGIQDYAPAWRP